MCLRKTKSRLGIGKHLSDIIPFQKEKKVGNLSSQLLLNFGLQYVIEKVQVNHDRLKLNGTN
jgi:hypothetical protein